MEKGGRNLSGQMLRVRSIRKERGNPVSNSRFRHEADECVFMQQGNMIFTNMVTGDRYNVEAGDRLYLPRGTIYSTMTHQGASYYWCSKKIDPKAANDADEVPDAALPANTETPW